jgi:hypothetical protein
VVTDEIKRGNAVVIASDSLAVDDAGARAQANQRLDDQREAVSEVIAGTASQVIPRRYLAVLMPIGHLAIYAREQHRLR